MLYYDDWCTLDYSKSRIVINAHIKEIKNKLITDINRDAVSNSISVVGLNPVLCLSGGVDSQAMVNIWKNYDFSYTAVTFDFGNNFNQTELSDALSFADFLKIPVKVIKLDIMRFLSRDLLDFSQKYQMASPQFCAILYSFLLFH